MREWIDDQDLATFEAGSKDYQAIAGVAEKLDETTLSKKDLAPLRRLLAHDGRLESRLEALATLLT